MRTLNPRTGWVMVAATASLLTLMSGLYWGLPIYARHRIVEDARVRGIVLDLDVVNIQSEGIELRRLQYRHVDSPTALRGFVRRVRIEAPILELLWNRRQAIRRVELTAPELEIDSADRALPEILRSLAGSRERRGDGANAGDTRRPPVIVSDGRFQLLDASGVLFDVGPFDTELNADAVVFDARAAALNPEGIAAAQFRDAMIQLGRRDDGWEIDEAFWRGPRVHFPHDAQAGHMRQLAERLRAVADLVGAFRRGGVSASDAESAEETSRRHVVFELIRLLAGRLAERGSLRFSDLEVFEASSEFDRPLIRGLDASIERSAPGEFRFAGHGRPGNRGRLRWEFLVRPEDLRAQGSLEFRQLALEILTPFLPDLPFHEPAQTLLEGELAIQAEGTDRLDLRGEISVTGFGMSSSRIAPRPIRGIDLTLRGQADWFPSGRRLAITSLDLSLGTAEARLHGEIELASTHYRIDLTGRLPMTDCNRAIGAIPPGLLGSLVNFRWTGRLGGRIRLQVDSRDLQASELDIRVTNACEFDMVPAFAMVDRFRRPFLHRVVEDRGDEPAGLFSMEAGPGASTWTSIFNISPFLVQAVLAHEDGSFFRHQGFSTDAIRRALVRNLEAGRFAYGASTISMQLVKNLYLRREKTLARKIQEVILTWWLESQMTKTELLELYLNVIEYGPGVYGIRQAAQHYFGRVPGELSAAESAYLAMILPNPRAFHEHWEEGRLPRRWRRRVARFLRVLERRRRFDAVAVAAGVRELSDFYFHSPEHAAPLPRTLEGQATPLPLEAPVLTSDWEDFASQEDVDGPSHDAERSDEAMGADGL